MQSQRQYPRRKRTRLPAPVYADTSNICSVVLNTLDRLPIFAGATFAAACMDLLTNQAATHGVTLYAYCFMPDHVHLLISPSSTMSIIEFVRRFKSLSTHMAWDRGHSGLVWQQGFYDHFLRRDEDLQRAIAYILDNPVRAGLAENAEAYAFSGLGSGVDLGSSPGGGVQDPARREWTRTKGAGVLRRDRAAGHNPPEADAR